MLAGPFCTQLLADMGADVVKIEGPDGDLMRRTGTVREGLSWYFAQFNRNKRSVVLDLYGDPGRAALADLLRSADVLVENFRPGVLARMGFGPERIEEINPRLIVASVNGYGSTGPYAERPSFDFIAQAMSGFMAASGAPGRRADANRPADRRPRRRALRRVRGRLRPPRAGPPEPGGSGRGRPKAGNRSRSGATRRTVRRDEPAGRPRQHARVHERGVLRDRPPAGSTGNDHPIAAPYGLFEASDGHIAVAPPDDAYVRRFLRVIGLETLLDRPEYATNEARRERRRELADAINERTRTRTVDHWIGRLNEGGCPCGRVMDVPEVFSDPQVLAQDLVLDVPHPGAGRSA